SHVASGNGPYAACPPPMVFTLGVAAATKLLPNAGTPAATLAKPIGRVKLTLGYGCLSARYPQSHCKSADCVIADCSFKFSDYPIFNYLICHHDAAPCIMSRHQEPYLSATFNPRLRNLPRICVALIRSTLSE